MALDGVLVVDKPAGMTSHDVVARVRRAAGQRKVGHAGTLDPAATGVLVVCLGRATRLVPYVQASRKTYAADMTLGLTTTTLDGEGEVVATVDASGVDEPTLCATMEDFVGQGRQIPPMVSAVRVGGERLHAKARRGETVERKARDVTVHDLVLEDFRPGPVAHAAFLVTCSPGTYVRALAADIGDRLGVGGHLSGLRRLGSGRFDIADAVPLEAVVERGQADTLPQVLLSLADAVADYPPRHLTDAEAAALGHGRPLPATGRAGPLAALDASGGLVAMIEDHDGVAKPLAVFAT